MPETVAAGVGQRCRTIGDVTVVRTERAVAGGEILAHHDDGRVLFVSGALPDELVEVTLYHEKARFAKADVIRVVEPSPDRVVEPCRRRHEGCGGCDWMHVEPRRQLDHKASVVTDALVRTAHLTDPPVARGGTVPANAYRTTIRAVGNGDGRLGFRARRSHDVVVAGGCLIAHPTLVELLDTVRVSPGLEITLRVSEASDEITARWDPATGEVHGLPMATGTTKDAVVHELVAGASLQVSSASFFQSGPAAAELIVDTLATLVPELARAGSVVDAYAGVGVLGRTTVPSNASLVTIETSKWAAADAAINRPGALVHVGDVGRPAAAKFVARHVDDIDVVIADPSRRGLGRAAVDALAGMRAPVLALVSCDPVSLARDAALLSDAGYALERVIVVDLFPQTHHVETVARFVHE